MSQILPRTHRRALFAVALAAFATFLFGACSSEAAASFDPHGPCTGDGQRPGAYPDLEAQLPAAFDGAGP